MIKMGKRRERISSNFCFMDTSKSYVKESSRYQSRFSFQSDKRKDSLKVSFLSPAFYSYSIRQDFHSIRDPVIFHENYIYICQKCPSALSLPRYHVDKSSISLDTRLNH